MSDPLLSYQGLAQPASTPLRSGTWIYLLILGILYCLGGLCSVGSLALVYSVMQRTGATANAGLVLLVAGGVMLLLSAGVGAAYIWASLRIRRGSRAAATTAMILAIVNASLIGLLVCLGTIGIISNRNSDPSSLVGIIFYLVPIGMNVAAAILTGKLRRQT